MLLKILFLNTMDFQIQPQITNFITFHAPSTHLFCFQETYSPSSLTLAQSLLPDFLPVHIRKQTPAGSYAQTTFLHPQLSLLSQSALLDEPDQAATGLCLYTQIAVNSQILHLCNLHGIAFPGDKLDTPGRLQQSSHIIDFLHPLPGPKIVGGDFNLDIHSRSVHLFPLSGFDHLINQYRVPTTRNHLAWDLHPVKQLYADYVFTKDVAVASFTVPPDIVSDHQPMLLEIAI